MVGSDGGGDDVVSNVFVVGWLSEFGGRVCTGQFAWRSWFCTDTLEVCLMTVSKSPRCPCLMEGSVGVGIEIGIRKGRPKTDGLCLQCLRVFMEFRYEPRRHGENGHFEWHHALWPNDVH